MKKKDIEHALLTNAESVFALNYGHAIIDEFTTKHSHNSSRRTNSTGAVAVRARRVYTRIDNNGNATVIVADSPGVYTLTQVEFVYADNLEEFAAKQEKRRTDEQATLARRAAEKVTRQQMQCKMQNTLNSLLNTHEVWWHEARVDERDSRTTITLSDRALAALVDLLETHTTSEEV